MSLPSLSVRGIHVTPDLPSARMRVDMFMTMRGANQEWNLPNTLITPGRVSQSLRNIAFSSQGYDEAMVSGEPARLRGLPALVLRDRLPAANPFDGSVPWQELPREGFGRSEIIAGGGATAWDGRALGGTFQFLTQPLFGKLVTEKGNGRGRAIDGGPLKQNVLPTAELAGTIGGLGTRQLEWNVAEPTTRGVLQVLGGIHSTNGYDLIDASQRGPIDEAAWNRGRWLEASWRQPAGKEGQLTASFRAYENAAGNGTPGQHRETRGTMLAIAMAGSGTGGLTWNGAVYLQNDNTAATLSAIDGRRLEEKPARRLADAPASALGASWTGSWWHLHDARTTIGVDIQHVRGESREEFAVAGDHFQREVTAGGQQDRAGVSVLHQQPMGARVRSTFGVRLEGWAETSGRRRELDHLTGVPVRDEHFADDYGGGLIPSGGIVWQIGRGWRLRANSQLTFRRPTLAERYQTWGSQGIVTEAAPALMAEKNLSSEAALEYGFPPGFTFGATVFKNDLRDLIGSRVDAGQPALPGLFFRQRINLEEAEIQGLQFSAGRSRLGPFSLYASVLFNDTRIVSSSTAPGLIGKKIAGVPAHRVRVSASWQATSKVTIGLAVRAIGRQFADEENSRPVASAILADATLSYVFSAQAQFHLQLENIADARREMNRDPAGLFYLGTPRLATAGFRFRW